MLHLYCCLLFAFLTRFQSSVGILIESLLKVPMHIPQGGVQAPYARRSEHKTYKCVSVPPADVYHVGVICKRFAGRGNANVNQIYQELSRLR